MEHGIVYRCVCGETIGLPLIVAHDLGLLAEG
jgi:hypothetical protein